MISFFVNYNIMLNLFLAVKMFIFKRFFYGGPFKNCCRVNDRNSNAEFMTHLSYNFYCKKPRIN